jgi:DNA-binding HxlR family transcriptional regulator
MFHHRWSIPLVAGLRDLGGARFVHLVHALGVGRETLRQTLDALIDAQVVERNPGHGHPLRPEYVLTPRGATLAPACATLLAALRAEGLEDVGLRKWSIPVVLELAVDRRFGALRDALGASPRALSLALRALAEAKIVERRVAPGYPPSTTYRLTETGRRIRRAAEPLSPETEPAPAGRRPR